MGSWTILVGRHHKNESRATIRALQALRSVWEWYASLMGDYPPRNYPPVKGFELTLR